MKFELCANIRLCRSRKGLSILRRPVDLLIVRKSTEGFYSDRNMFADSGEFMPEPDMALSIRKITAKRSARLTRAALELVSGRRKKVTAVHKANVVSCLTNLREVRRVAADVALGELIVDATAVLLIRTSDRFDVIVTTGMFGDVLLDEASGLEAFGPGAAVTVARPRRSRW